jgi:hypothetical protein
MRRKMKVSQLRKIADIRALQRAASEGEAARANLALVERSQALERTKRERAADEEQWRDMVCGSNFNLGVIPLWTRIVMRRDVAVRQAADEAETAKSIRDRSLSRLHAAEQRSDVAENMARRALREHLRKIEKDALQAAADQHLQRRREE